MSQTLSKAAFSALRWNYIGFLSRSLSNVGIGVLLARLLGPKPFGELAVASLVVGVANLIADAGFTSALVQAPTLSEIEIRFVFTVQFLIAAALTAACAASAGLLSVTFHDPAMKPILWAISPMFLLQALGQTSIGILRRELQFRAIQITQTVSYICSIAIAIPLALKGAGVWSLVAAQLGQSLIYSAMMYLRVRHTMMPSLDRSGLILLRFGSKVTIANMTNWGISNLDNAIVGRSFGPTSLGLYSRAFSLGSAPADSVVNTLQQVLFAACSRTEGRVETIRRAYFASLSAVAIIIFPAFWAMSACASTVIVGLYGERWRPSAPLFCPLAIGISVHAIMALAGPILNAVDEVRREIVSQAWSLAFALVVFLSAARFSVTWLAWGVCAVYIFRFLVATWPTLAYLRIGWGPVFRVLRGPSIVGLFTAATLSVIDHVLIANGVRPAVDLAALIAAGICLLCAQILLAGHLILSPEMIGFLQSGISRMPPAAARFLLRCASRQQPFGVVGPELSSEGGSLPL